MTQRFVNRLNKDDVKFNVLNPVWDNDNCDALNVFEMIDELNRLNDKEVQRTKEITQCHCDIAELLRELDYYKAKCGSLEKGLFEAQRELDQLKTPKVPLLDYDKFWKEKIMKYFKE